MHARWLFLPVGGAWIAHAPVLRWNLAPALNRPIDGGRTLRGRRLFGDNKTWRGAAVMFTGAVATTLALTRAGWFRRRLPEELAAAPPLAYGAPLGAGVVGGGLAPTFYKRPGGRPP